MREINDLTEPKPKPMTQRHDTKAQGVTVTYAITTDNAVVDSDSTLAQEIDPNSISLNILCSCTVLCTNHEDRKVLFSVWHMNQLQQLE